MAKLIQKWENTDYRPKQASTEFEVGYFVSYNGTGEIKPAENADLYGSATPILGVILEKISSSDDDYTSTRQVGFQYAHGFKFQVAVSAGTAIESMIGNTYDVDGNNPANIDLSTAGTQLRITAVLADDLVEVSPALVDQEG